MSTGYGARDACTLPTAERPLRLAEFDDLFVATWGLDRRSATQLELALPLDSENAARGLAVRETACCSFFSFDFTTRDEVLLMRVNVPSNYVDVLDALEARIRPALSPDR